MKLKTLLKTIPFWHATKSIEHLTVQSVAVDSRQVSKGDLFICIKGFTVDGHDFAKEAELKGASAIVAEHPVDVSIPVIIVSNTTRALALIAATFYQYPTEAIKLIGITGTNGKTTITYLLEAIFKHYKQRTGIIGTIQMKIHDQSIPLINTTPDALFLQKSFAHMVKEEVDVATIEVSSHALDLGRVYGCDFDLAIFTNLSQDHLDYHKTMAEYFHAKSLLFSQLGNKYSNEPMKYAIINKDDPYSEPLMKMTAQPVITYGVDQPADITASDIDLQATHTAFTLNTPKGKMPIKSRLLGKFNIYNMLAATSAALAFDVPLSIIQEALEKIEGVSGRFEQIREGQPFSVIVDYAHTPDSLENVLQTIKEFAENKVYVVVGCGGDRDRGKRPLMADVAVKYADHAIFTSDNPRTEDPKAIIEDMTSHLSVANYEEIVDRKEAIERAIQVATDGDVVLIAGRGHETEQQIGQQKIKFDDREVAREALKKRKED